MNSANPSAAMSLWLAPCKREANDWQQLIDSLATKYDAPRFAAHVTAATIDSTHLGAQHLMSDAIDWLEAVAGDFAPLTLAVSPPSIGESFFQCVLCQLPTGPVARIGQSFLALAGNGQVRQGSQNMLTRTTQNAHISLLYSEMAPAQRKRIAETIVWPAGPLTLDTLMLIGPGEGETSFKNPQSWEVLGSATLTGKPVSA